MDLKQSLESKFPVAMFVSQDHADGVIRSALSANGLTVEVVANTFAEAMKFVDHFSTLAIAFLGRLEGDAQPHDYELLAQMLKKDNNKLKLVDLTPNRLLLTKPDLALVENDIDIAALNRLLTQVIS